MHDDGCLILPTHRLIGGLKFFDIDSLKIALEKKFTVEEAHVSEKETAQI